MPPEAPDTDVDLRIALVAARRCEASSPGPPAQRSELDHVAVGVAAVLNPTPVRRRAIHAAVARGPSAGEDRCGWRRADAQSQVGGNDGGNVGGNVGGSGAEIVDVSGPGGAGPAVAVEAYEGVERADDRAAGGVGLDAGHAGSTVEMPASQSQRWSPRSCWIAC